MNLFEKMNYLDSVKEDHQLSLEAEYYVDNMLDAAISRVMKDLQENHECHIWS